MTNQILLSLLNCSWQWGLLGGLTWIITRRFRHTNSTTHLLWLLYLLSLPILFALNQFVPALSFGGTVPELTETQHIEISSIVAHNTNMPEITTTESSRLPQSHTVTGSQNFFNWTTTNLLLCIWTIGTLIMLIRVTFGLYRIRRLRRSATLADDSYQAVCNRLAQKLEINRSVTVCFSYQVVAPISFGWLSPFILIPHKLNMEQFELVAAHELAHVQRLDWLTNLFSHVVGAIFFFHPIYHFLNRKLVHLRERICDDWVIQLTGARKNYAQCLLDLVRRENRTVPLALSLNQPSQLESRINSILKSKRQLDMQLKPRILILASFVFLVGLPLLSMAQLMPLRTVPLSLFAQPPQESEEVSEKVKKKSGEKKKLAEMKENKKDYKKDNSVQVLDPSGYNKSQENPVFSGPQSGEKLHPLMVTGISGDFEGKEFNIIKASNGKPLVLFLQDDNGLGLKGLHINAGTITSIMNKVDGELHTAVVFLSDNMLNTTKIFTEFGKLPDQFHIGMSLDGREGPGVYGLNRNVAQTVIVAKDGKVLHNFAFTQPMLYINPHLLGAIAQAIEVEPATLEKWLNEASAKHYKEDDLGKKTIASKFAELQKAIRNGKIPRMKVAEHLKKLGITWEEGEQLLKEEKDDAQMMRREGWIVGAEGPILRSNDDAQMMRREGWMVGAEGPILRSNDDAQMMRRERQYENRRQIEVADPADFGTSKEKQIFSGPQPGEKLPPLLATGIRGGAKGKTFDFIAKADDGKLFVLLLQDDSGVGLRGLYDIAGVVDIISNASKQELQMSVVFLGDDPTALKQITQHVPKNVGDLVGISPDGREGPGNYGLNRNVAQTIIIAKDGKVLHNFAFTQPLLYADPYLIGAIAQTIGADPSTVEKWLNEEATENERMQRDSGQMEREDARDRERTPSREELVKRFDKDGDGKLNEAEGMAARRALANRENQTRSRIERVIVKSPDEFKRDQDAKIFSGPQLGEKLPPLNAMAINGETKGKTYDVIAKTDGHPIVLFLQDDSGLGLRGLVGFSRLLAKVTEKSKKKLHIKVVFLGDSPDTLAKQASKIVPHIPSDIILGISPDGREGPGSYGLNRSVAQTVIIAKDGKVLHNFAFTQPILRPDPHVLGAIGEAIGVEPATLEKWLNEAPAEDERMERGDTSEEARAFGRRLREMVQKGEITGEEARKRYEKAFPRSKE